eukprot:gnl/MRDRNA2_/MRDRNA2_133625_c0_seq1.p1 gnl/MRDRNA2_/MRDRNA2_133625_c0~~gnl/MRDRNA2_/MRDRNA2_133625_c0_seq1.p1  ORF type:complete len:724 (+),score=119.57 gnl/MRDRNA2_/MRDRNA2_133625_c0_seq1:148-2319(+)
MSLLRKPVTEKMRSGSIDATQSMPVGSLRLLHNRRSQAAGVPLLQAVVDDSTDKAEAADGVVDFLGTIEVFQDLSREEALKVAQCFRTRVVDEGGTVFRQGDPGHEIFFIESGTVEVKLRTASTDREEIQIGTLSCGDHFGEAALLTNTARSASIYALGGVVVLKVLTREQFDDLGLREKMGLTLEEMVEFMDKIEAFRHMDREYFPTVARALISRVVPSGEAIVRQGDPGHELFFIERGMVEVKIRSAASAGRSSCRSSDGCDQEVLIATLSRGDYFGEAALLKDEPRNASVYAVDGDVVVKVLSREQFEKLGLKNKLDLQVKYTQLSNGIKTVFLDSMLSLRALGRVFVFLLVYCLLACLVFSPLESWAWGDCIYFAIVTLTTVGYGDLSPKRPFSRIFLLVLVLAGLMIVATSIGEFLEHLVTAEIKNDKSRKLLRLKHQKEVGIFDQDKQRGAWKFKFTMNILGIVALLSLTTVACKLLMGETLLDAFYFSFVTLTTIGYGDVVPHHGESKIVVSVLCLFGVPAFAMCLGRVVEIAYGKARNNQIHRIVGGLTPEKFNHLIDFCDEMWRKGAYNSKPQPSRRCEITPFEFLCFILVKNESVSIDDIKAIMDNFSELDVDSNGTLEKDDLEEWLRRGARNPASLEREKSAHRIRDHLSRGTVSEFGKSGSERRTVSEFGKSGSERLSHLSVASPSSDANTPRIGNSFDATNRWSSSCSSD